MAIKYSNIHKLWPNSDLSEPSKFRISCGDIDVVVHTSGRISLRGKEEALVQHALVADKRVQNCIHDLISYKGQMLSGGSFEKLQHRKRCAYVRVARKESIRLNSFKRLAPFPLYTRKHHRMNYYSKQYIKEILSRTLSTSYFYNLIDNSSYTSWPRVDVPFVFQPYYLRTTKFYLALTLGWYKTFLHYPEPWRDWFGDFMAPSHMGRDTPILVLDMSEKYYLVVVDSPTLRHFNGGISINVFRTDLGMLVNSLCLVDRETQKAVSSSSLDLKYIKDYWRQAFKYCV